MVNRYSRYELSLFSVICIRISRRSGFEMFRIVAGLKTTCSSVRIDRLAAILSARLNLLVASSKASFSIFSTVL